MSGVRRSWLRTSLRFAAVAGGVAPVLILKTALVGVAYGYAIATGIATAIAPELFGRTDRT